MGHPYWRDHREVPVTDVTGITAFSGVLFRRGLAEGRAAKARGIHVDLAGRCIHELRRSETLWRGSPCASDRVARRMVGHQFDQSIAFPGKQLDAVAPEESLGMPECWTRVQSLNSMMVVVRRRGTRRGPACR